MLVFEPRIYGVGSDRSTSWATTTAQVTLSMRWQKKNKNKKVWRQHTQLEIWKIALAGLSGIIKGLNKHKHNRRP